ncbi:hypothetical protein ACFOW1_06435 [Parasediminibacterium paludis]|uniref:Uncharacterized protein n=1 Tax=Parasediminibacterium paludis TaxID=908966 RepID=A0ABV8PX44_9BACT
MCYCIVTRGNCQDILTNTTKDSSLNLTPKQIESYTTSIDKKAASISKQVEKANTKALKDLQQQEEKLQKKLAKVDSNLAKQLFEPAKQQFANLNNKIAKQKSTTDKLQNLAGGNKEYLPLLDTFNTSLKFLDGKLGDIGSLKNQTTKALASVKGLEDELKNAADIKAYIKQRKEAIQAIFTQNGMVKDLQGLNKQAYYYGQQINEYKQLLKDPKKLEERAIVELTKSSLFKDFMQRNSQLASLFSVPANYGTPQALAGLQTRASVNQLLQARLGNITSIGSSNTASGAGGNPQQYLQQQVQTAQSELNKLKDQINKAGGSSSDLEMPDFKPNTQKTKRFLDRLEYGLDVQTAKQNSLFPVTSDIGLTVGYKLNDKSTIGVGVSYKMGWGSGFNNIKLTSEGIGLRSFVDMKLKGSLLISGGYEQNYMQRFGSIGELYNLPQTAWRQSALLGLTKKIIITKKKSTKIQVLYDFLNQQNHVPSPPILFRVGWGM